jgi:hypothetical protein
MPHDVDTWLQDPTGQHVCFNQREKGLMHLDRDDQGRKGDSYRDGDGNKIEYPYNREVTSIRGIISGEWTANIHFYSVEYYETQQPVRSWDNADSGLRPENYVEKQEELSEDGEYPVEVTIRLDKINPFKTVIEQKVILKRKGDEETAFRFTVGRDGRIISTNTLKKNIATMGVEEREQQQRRQQQEQQRRQQILKEEFRGRSGA